MVQMFGLSPTNKLIANGNGKALQLWNLQDVQKGAWYLNIASKSVKTYKEDPEFPEGASRITITQSKLIVALGNLIRAYSFDLLPSNDD